VSDWPGVGLVEACDDPRILGHFHLWPAQRALLARIEAGPRTQVIAWGRRGTKTTMQALIGVWACTLRPGLRRFLRPRERGYAVGVATNLRQARLLIAAAQSVIDQSPLLSQLVDAATEDEIRFKTGHAFAAFPCSARGGRGWAIHTLLMDEAAHFVDSEGNAAAEPVWRALSPATVQFGGDGRIVVASTPFGSAGFFADLHARAAAGELPEAVAHTAASVDVNPTLSQAFLEQERLVLGDEAFASEYLAEFVGSGGAYLDPAVIDDAVADRDVLDRQHGVGWVAGLDPAFSSDPFGLAIVGRDPKQRSRLLLGLARSWQPGRVKPTSFEERRQVEDALLDEVADVCLAYRVSKVLTDQYAAAPTAERLRQRGLTVQTVPMTTTSKTAVFATLRARLNLGQLELYPQPDLLVELRRLRSKFTAGAASVVNPRVGGSHGDLAQALAMACSAFASSGRPARMSRPGDLWLDVGGLASSDSGRMRDYVETGGLR